MAISPQQPDIVYAAIELDRRTGGIFMSENMGESWKKMSDAVAGATEASLLSRTVCFTSSIWNHILNERENYCFL